MGPPRITVFVLCLSACFIFAQGQPNIGATGLPGVPGPPGSIGYTGGTGATGPEGFPGQNGYPGPAGSIGPRGQQGIAQTGATGQMGEFGERGPNGIPGPSVYIQESGRICVEGPPGPRGRSGRPGQEGPAGDPGRHPDDLPPSTDGPYPPYPYPETTTGPFRFPNNNRNRNPPDNSRNRNPPDNSRNQYPWSTPDYPWMTTDYWQNSNLPDLSHCPYTSALQAIAVEDEAEAFVYSVVALALSVVSLGSMLLVIFFSLANLRALRKDVLAMTTSTTSTMSILPSEGETTFNGMEDTSNQTSEKNHQYEEMND